MVRQKAQDCCRIVRKLLSGLEVQKELAREYQLAEKGYPPSSCYPTWAYQLAFVLYDPHQLYSDEIKGLISYNCRLLVDEFDTSEQGHTRYLQSQRNVELLAEIARDLGAGKYEQVLH